MSKPKGELIVASFTPRPDYAPPRDDHGHLPTGFGRVLPGYFVPRTKHDGWLFMMLALCVAFIGTALYKLGFW